MMQSLRARLMVLIVLLSGAGIAAGALMLGLFYQSATAQAGEAEAQIARACDAIAAAYRFYGTDWAGPATLEDTAVRNALTAVVQTALRDRPGVEGGLWQAQAGALAYAYPTYQGAGPKTDLPSAERARIRAVNAAALAAERPVSRRYAGSTEVRLLAACPLPGPIRQLTAWTMARVVTFAGRAYQQLMAGLAILLATVVAAVTLLIRLTVAWTRHVTRIEEVLQTAAVASLPQLPPTGERELDRIVGALNLAGLRLADAQRHADVLARQMAHAERLSSIGRVAAGVAHEIRNPIAAMRLKAENALRGDVPRKDAALAMILEQIARLDRLLSRLLSLSERDPPQRSQVAVGVFLAACTAEHAELAAAKNVTLSVRSDVETAWIDPEQMRRAVANLLLNAIHAAPAGTAVETGARRDADECVLYVRDEGPGVPPEILHQLFEPFVTGRPDGTGLGLSVVQEIAAAHGGRARLAPASRGTTLEIGIPWR